MSTLRRILSAPEEVWVRTLILAMLVVTVFWGDLVISVPLAPLYVLAIIFSNIHFGAFWGRLLTLLSFGLAILVERPSFDNLETVIMYSILAVILLAAHLISRQVNVLQAELAGQAVRMEEEKAKQQALRNDIFSAISIAIEYKDPFTQGHSIRVANYTRLIAKELQYDESEIADITTAALLHDIGKINVDGEILRKPSGLTLAEKRIVEKHVADGASILERIPSVRQFIPVVKYHHERWDGLGYPQGLKGNTIPLSARIIAVADTFEALTSDRSYRNKKTSQEAVQEIVRCSGTQFDPEVVEAFLRVMEAEGVITKQKAMLNQVESSHLIYFYEKGKIGLRKQIFELVTDSIVSSKKVIGCFEDDMRMSLKKTFSREVKRGQIILLRADQFDWYGDSALAMQDNLKKMYTEALEEGYKGLVISVDSDHLAMELGFRNLLKAESLITGSIENLQINVVCMYSLETLEDPRANDLIGYHTHLLDSNHIIDLSLESNIEAVRDKIRAS